MLHTRAFVSRIKIGIDFFPQRGLSNEIATAINGRSSAQGRVRSLPVVMVLPFLQLLFEVGRIALDPRPELLQRGALGALDLAVELR